MKCVANMGCPFPTGEESGDGDVPPSHKFFLLLPSRNILGRLFTSEVLVYNSRILSLFRILHVRQKTEEFGCFNQATTCSGLILAVPN